LIIEPLLFVCVFILSVFTIVSFLELLRMSSVLADAITTLTAQASQLDNIKSRCDFLVANQGSPADEAAIAAAVEAHGAKIAEIVAVVGPGL